MKLLYSSLKHSFKNKSHRNQNTKQSIIFLLFCCYCCCCYCCCCFSRVESSLQLHSHQDTWLQLWFALGFSLWHLAAPGVWWAPTVYKVDKLSVYHSSIDWGSIGSRASHTPLWCVHSEQLLPVTILSTDQTLILYWRFIFSEEEDPMLTVTHFRNRQHFCAPIISQCSQYNLESFPTDSVRHPWASLIFAHTPLPQGFPVLVLSPD